MGISVRVVVEPKWISKQAWRQVYAETLELLRAWPDPPLHCALRTVAGVEVFTYTREVVEEDRWRVCGDARSRQVAETNELPRELGVERPAEPDSDVVVRELGESCDSSLRRLLGNKTQGLPFHTLMVAVGMLIEHRLPRAAVMLGDVDRYDARKAQRELELILRERIPLPVCVDRERMRARLQPHVDGAALDELVDSALGPYVDARDRTARLMLEMFPNLCGCRPSEREELRDAVTCSEIVELSPRAQELFEALAVEVAITAREAGLAARFAQASADELLRALAEGGRAVSLCLTDMAWDEILRASLAELRLLAALVWMSPFNLGIEAKRAVFESAAVRRLCVDAAANAPAKRAKGERNEFVHAPSERSPFRADD